GIRVVLLGRGKAYSRRRSGPEGTRLVGPGQVRHEGCVYVPGPLRYLNLGITLSVRSRMVVITASRGTEAVQLTSNMISSVLKSSRSIAILSTTASGVPKRLTSAVASGLAEPASVLPMLTLPA